MEKENLLQEACREFCHEFKGSPKEKGYPVIKEYDGTVIFASAQNEADAFIRSEKISNQTYIGWGVIIFVWMGLVLWHFWANKGTKEINFLSWDIGFILIFGSAWQAVDYFRKRKLKKICRDKILWYQPYYRRSAFELR